MGSIFSSSQQEDDNNGKKPSELSNQLRLALQLPDSEFGPEKEVKLHRSQVVLPLLEKVQKEQEGIRIEHLLELVDAHWGTPSELEAVPATKQVIDKIINEFATRNQLCLFATSCILHQRCWYALSQAVDKLIHMTTNKKEEEKQNNKNEKEEQEDVKHHQQNSRLFLMAAEKTPIPVLLQILELGWADGSPDQFRMLVLRVRTELTPPRSPEEIEAEKRKQAAARKKKRELAKKQQEQEKQTQQGSCPLDNNNNNNSNMNHQQVEEEQKQEEEEEAVSKKPKEKLDPTSCLSLIKAFLAKQNQIRKLNNTEKDYVQKEWKDFDERVVDTFLRLA